MTVTDALPPLGVSSRDESRMDEVRALAASGAPGVAALIGLLSEPSWVVRRAVIGALARMGAPAVQALCVLLSGDRASERLLAAAIDALVLSSGDVEAAVLKLADTNQPAILCDVAQILGRRRSTSAIAQLSRWSAHEDDNVAVASLEALGRIGGAASIEPLLRAVDTRHFFRTFPAIAVLGQSGDPRAVPRLVALLLEPHYAIEAAHALGRSGLLSAVVPLARLLVDPNDEIVRAAARGLSELRARNVERFGDASAVTTAFRAAGVGATAAPRAREALRGAEREDVVALATVLGWLEDSAGVETLLALLGGDPAIGDVAAAALRGLGHEIDPALRAAIRAGGSAERARLLPLLSARRSAVSELLVCLTDPDPAVRAQACDALGRIGDPSAVATLFTLIGDDEPSVAQAASAAIQSLGSDETKHLAFVAARSSDPRTRRAAMRIVASFGYPEALDLLLGALADDDERVRDASTMGLAHLEEPRAAAALVGATRHTSAPTRAAAMRALGSAAVTPDVVNALRRGLDDDDTWVRYFACQSLGKRLVTAAAERIHEMIDDPAGQVRIAAVDAIARIGGDRALAALTRASRSSDADVRRAALDGLGRLRRPDGYALLLEAAASGDPGTRLASITALAEWSSGSADAALVRAAADDDERVRAAAFELLATRKGADPTRWLVGRLSFDPDRERAMKALSQHVDGRIEGILSALETADERTAAWLVESLLRMRLINGNAAAEAALHFDNVYARRAAATALASVDNATAREALALAASADPDMEVRRICAAAS